MPALNALTDQLNAISPKAGAVAALANSFISIPFVRQAASGEMQEYGPSIQKLIQTYAPNNGSNSWVIGSGVSPGKMTGGSYGNGNPMAMGGFGSIKYAGREFTIANPIVQQQQFSQSYNKGRYDMGEYFLANPYGKTNTMPYSNLDASVQRAEQIAVDHPDWMTNGALDSSEQAKINYQKAEQNFIDTQNIFKDTTKSERVDTMGNIIATDYNDKLAAMGAAQAKLNAEASVFTASQTRSARLRAADEARNKVNDMTQTYKGIISPVYSNLQIKETVIK